MQRILRSLIKLLLVKGDVPPGRPILFRVTSLPPQKRLHLSASLLAVGIALVAIVAGLLWCRQLEVEYIHALAPEFTDEKLQGAALQTRVAYRYRRRSRLNRAR